MPTACLKICAVLAILSPRFVDTPLPYIGVLLTLSIDIIFDSPTLQIADVFYGRPLSQKNEIAKKGKNVVMTSKTHYFVSLLLLLPYLEELKKSSSTLQAANPVHLKVLLFHAQCAGILGVLRWGRILLVLLIRTEEF